MQILSGGAGVGAGGGGRDVRRRGRPAAVRQLSWVVAVVFLISPALCFFGGSTTTAWVVVPPIRARGTTTAAGDAEAHAGTHASWRPLRFMSSSLSGSGASSSSDNINPNNVNPNNFNKPPAVERARAISNAAQEAQDRNAEALAVKKLLEAEAFSAMAAAQAAVGVERAISNIISIAAKESEEAKKIEKEALAVKEAAEQDALDALEDAEAAAREAQEYVQAGELAAKEAKEAKARAEKELFNAKKAADNSQAMVALEYAEQAAREAKALREAHKMAMRDATMAKRNAEAKVRAVKEARHVVPALEDAENAAMEAEEMEKNEERAARLADEAQARAATEFEVAKAAALAEEVAEEAALIALEAAESAEAKAKAAKEAGRQAMERATEAKAKAEAQLRRAKEAEEIAEEATKEAKEAAAREAEALKQAEELAAKQVKEAEARAQAEMYRAQQASDHGSFAAQIAAEAKARAETEAMAAREVTRLAASLPTFSSVGAAATPLQSGGMPPSPRSSSTPTATILAVPDGLLPRCARNFGWDRAKCDRVLTAYRQFMELKRQHQDWDASLLTPPLEVDKMWFEHILDVEQYVPACQAYFGRLVGRNPDGAPDSADRATSIQTTKISVQSRFAKEDIDSKIWSFGAPVESNVIPKKVEEAKKSLPWPPTASNSGKDKSDNDNDLVVQLSPDEQATLKGSGDKESTVVRIRDSLGNETFFKVRRNMPMWRIFDRWAERKGEVRQKFRFYLDGEKVGPDETPDMLKLDDQDPIVAEVA